jgi:GTP-binding protein
MTKHYPVRPLPSGSSPIVAIVGRPNVGKSTLFNRLVRSKIAIVNDEPGVTRDRHYVDTSAFGRPYTLVDTGGFDPDSRDPMTGGIASQVRAAITEADVILFVSDATEELLGADRAAVELLRAANKPVLYVANKADAPKRDADAFELYRLGVDEVLPISALHGRGIGDLETALIARLPDATAVSEEASPDVARIAVVGRPNAGKSSLINRILGEDRLLVDDRPGTTRDAIDTLTEREGRPYVLVDTAGIRRKTKVIKAEDQVESVSVLQAMRAMERSEVVVLLCDASDGVAEQDAKILGLAEERGRGLVIALNKSDLLTKEEHKKVEEQARDKLTFAPYAPIVRISAKTGRGIGELFATVDRVRASLLRRVTTGELNRFFETVLDTRPPPTMGGRSPRLYYVTQVHVAPPTFVIISNAPDSIHFSYQRFVSNQLRRRFEFEGVPLRVIYKEKRRRQ